MISVAFHGRGSPPRRFRMASAAVDQREAPSGCRGECRWGVAAAASRGLVPSVPVKAGAEGKEAGAASASTSQSDPHGLSTFVRPGLLFLGEGKPLAEAPYGLFDRRIRADEGLIRVHDHIIHALGPYGTHRTVGSLGSSHEFRTVRDEREHRACARCVGRVRSLASRRRRDRVERVELGEGDACSQEPRIGRSVVRTARRRRLCESGGSGRDLRCDGACQPGSTGRTPVQLGIRQPAVSSLR